MFGLWGIGGSGRAVLRRRSRRFCIVGRLFALARGSPCRRRPRRPACRLRLVRRLGPEARSCLASRCQVSHWRVSRCLQYRWWSTPLSVGASGIAHAHTNSALDASGHGHRRPTEASAPQPRRVDPRPCPCRFSRSSTTSRTPRCRPDQLSARLNKMSSEHVDSPAGGGVVAADRARMRPAG